MPSKEYNCLSCGASLPVDKPASQKSIACTYCEQANANPNFIENSTPIQTSTATKKVTEKGEKTDTPSHVIKINQTNLAIIYSVLTAMAGITLYVYYWFNPQNMWIYLLTSIAMLLPNISEAFTVERWIKVAIRETVKSHERYYIEYIFQDDGISVWCCKFAGYVFQVWFTYLFFLSIIPTFDDVGSNTMISGFLAIILPLFGVWIINTILRDIAKFFGRLFSK